MIRQFVRFAAIVAISTTAWACADETAPVAPESDLTALSPLGNGAPAESPTITDVAGDAASDEVAPEFTVLVEALELTGLDDALSRKGQLTVFAPTDAAFERLLERLETTKEELFEDPDFVEDVLLYHIAPGRRTSADVLDSKQIRSLDGRFFYPFSNDDGAFIRDGSEDTPDAMLLGDLLDLEATNGIVHAIDEVLLAGEGGQPGKKGQRPDHDDDDDEDDDEGEFEGMATLLSVDGDAPERSMRIEVAYGDMTVEVVVSEDGTDFDADGDLTDFDALLDALEVDDPMVKVEGEGMVEEDGTITAEEIKAETEDDDDGDEDDDYEFAGIADFVSLEGDAPMRTLRIDVEVMRDGGAETITVDVFEGETEFEDDGGIETFEDLLSALDDETMSVRVEVEGELREDGTVEAEEIEAWAMVVEPPVEEGNSLADIVTRLANAEEGAEFTILYAALDATGLLAALDADDISYTVFAPTDEAFGRVIDLLGTTPEALLANTDLLQQVLLYHVVDGPLSSVDVANSAELVTLQGGSVFPEFAMTGTALRDLSDLTSNAPLLAGQTDVEADNGVIHTIGEVLLFPLDP